MATLFILTVIYLAFINLGLPDSLLGAAWPSMHANLGVSLSSAGVLSAIVAGGTIISSFLSGRLLARFGTAKLTLASVAATGCALLGFFAAPSFAGLCVAAVPLGLGAGAVDAALNGYVALHYKAKHMSWLHCFWGVGATAGPLVMAFFIARNGAWRQGYLAISAVQLLCFTVLAAAYPLWCRVEASARQAMPQREGAAHRSEKSPFSLPGLRAALLAFFCYCAVEASTGLWAASYLVEYRGVSAETGARWTSFFYGGITVGRLLSGFAAMRFSGSALVRFGQGVAALGAVVLLLPLPLPFSLAGLVLIGLGCAPIYPGMLQDTPHRFGRVESQSVMGVQMAFAYMGTTFVPPLLGWIAARWSIGTLPFFLLSGIVLMALGFNLSDARAREA